MSSTATETSLSQTRSAIAAFRALKGQSKEVQKPEPSQGKYGPYFSPVEEPYEMRKIVAESISLEGGPAAVLLQLAYPAIGKGVHNQSDFTYRRIERGRRTVIYIYCMTFGTTEEKRLISDATHRAHAHVKGKDYDANDVDAQLWVAATIYWSMVKSYELVFGELDPERAERVYREFSVMATALRVPAEKWPQDLEAFQVCWDETVSNLFITEEAMAVTRDVLVQKGLSWGLTWLYLTIKGPATRAITTELLPDHVRNAFGIPSTAYTRRIFNWVTGINAAIVPWLPAALREFPKNYYMADMRKRIAAGKRL
jgi:uncharacterized protein (DUF2236 family)